MRVQLVGILPLLACGPSSSGGGPGGLGPVGQPTPAPQTFKAECEVVCREETEGTACTNVATSCVNGCVAMTAGLETQCGKCVAAQTNVISDEGYECYIGLGTIEYAACDDVCDGAEHTARPDFGAECAVICELQAASSGCAVTTCVSDCMAMTSGLPTQCGKCLALQTEIWSNEGECELEIGTIVYGVCEEDCADGGDVAQVDFRAECGVVCRDQAADAGCSAPSCVNDCVAMTLGVGNKCGKCVALQTEVLDSEEGGQCDVEVGTIEYSTCDAYCAVSIDIERPDFRAECESVCRTQSGAAGCTAPTCVSDCLAMTAGLDNKCGKCVALQTEVWDPEEGSNCELEVGTIEYTACDTFCAR